MRFRFPSLSIIALLGLLTDVCAQSVTFQLRNGDRLSGAIESETANSVTLKTSWGRITLPASDIVSARLRKDPTTNGHPAVLSPVASAPSPPLPPAKAHRWVGEIQAGLDVLFSEKERQLYSGRAKITHSYGKLRNLLDYQVSYGETDGLTTDNRMLGTLKSDFDLTKRLYVYNIGGAGYDAVREIDFLWDVGPGLGYHWVKRTNFVFRTEGGGNYHAEYLDQNEAIESFYLRLAEDAMWRITRRLTWDEKFEYFPNVLDTSHYRLRFETNLKYAILNNLSFILTVLDNYETQTAEGIPRNDLQIRSSIGVKF